MLEADAHVDDPIIGQIQREGGALPTIRVLDSGRARQEAVQVSQAVGSRLGLCVAGARVISDSNNTLVLLPEEQVVAKVSTSTLAERGNEALRRELAVGLHLASRGTPIVPPLGEGLGGPHEIDGVMLTLWHYCDAGPMPDDPGVELGRALRSVHAGLSDFPGELPHLSDQIERAAALFGNADATPQLSATDRRVARDLHDTLRALRPIASGIPLHGEPHCGNILWTENGARFTDFEATCVGPVEWDVAHLPERSQAAFPERDRALLKAMRIALSFCVAAWCAAQPGRAPAVDEAAAFHLEVLRRTALTNT